MKPGWKLYWLAVCFVAGMALARIFHWTSPSPARVVRPAPRADVAEPEPEDEERALGPVASVAPGYGLKGSHEAIAPAVREITRPPAPSAPAPAPPPRAASAGGAAWTSEAGGSGSRTERDPMTPAEQKALENAGLPSGHKEAFSAGAMPDVVKSIGRRIAGSPRLLRLLLNNGFVADGVMSREPMRRMCSNEGVLAAFLSGQPQPGIRPLTEDTSFFKSILSNGATAEAAVQSELAHRFAACPSMHALAADRSTLMKVFDANPDTLTYLTNTNLLVAAAADPDAMNMLQSASSAAAGRRP